MGDMVTAIQELRSTFFVLVSDLKQDGGAPKELEQILMASHYMHIRHQCVDHGLSELSTKISLSLLKYAAVVPADKLFYIAGMACKEEDQLTLAFVLLNRYIDLTEAIEDGDASMLDNADLAETCIPAPFESELPKNQYQAENKREEVRDWVLAMSMDQAVEQSLPTREDRGGASIYDVLYTSKNPPCIVTGYPIPPNQVLEMTATSNKQDWNKFVSKAKTDPWTSQPQNPVY